MEPLMRVRYETFCSGRLLKVFEQVNVTTLGDLADAEADGAPADGVRFVDGAHFWKIVEQRVADDVAQAMLAKWEASPDPLKAFTNRTMDL
jgi:hypothetical protein